MIPISPYAKAKPRQVDVAHTVALGIGMLATIQLDYDFGFEADEIDDVWPERYLSPKLDAVQPTIP